MIDPTPYIKPPTENPNDDVLLDLKIRRAEILRQSAQNSLIALQLRDELALIDQAIEDNDYPDRLF